MDKLIVLLFICGVSSDCPTGFDSSNGNSCYRVMNHLSENWIDSRDYCLLEGSMLLKVETAEEQAYIEEILNQTFYKNENTSIRVDLWIDAGDFMSENEYRWFYADGHSDLFHGYTNFAPGEPNNSGYQEHCIYMHFNGHSGQWGDTRCDQRRLFICEKSNGNDMNSIIG